MSGVPFFVYCFAITVVFGGFLTLAWLIDRILPPDRDRERGDW